MSENGRKSMIKVRGGFSDKTGIDPCNTQMQINDFDERTRALIGNRLFNICCLVFNPSSSYEYNQLQLLKPQYRVSYHSQIGSDFCRALLSDVFNLPIRKVLGTRFDWEFEFAKISDVISNAPYNEVLDILWYTCSWISRYATADFSSEMYKAMNSLFEEEYVGYRFISGEIVPITDEIEVKEIEQAQYTPFEGARKHLQKSLNFLSDRERPDYKNCIKESISAVEATCRIITKKDKATLGEALKLLAKHGLELHPCLNSGIDKLYSYACDQGGVRHAEHEAESIVTFEEAKFMMVTCSAIVNYLVAEYGKHGAGNA